MRPWLQQNRLIVLFLGAAVLIGYTHQLSGQILSHHHCAEHASDHSNHDNDDNDDNDDDDDDHDHSSQHQDHESPADTDSTCHCDQCHLVSVAVELSTVFTAHAAVAPLAAQPKVLAPESPVPDLDLPPIILSA